MSQLAAIYQQFEKKKPCWCTAYGFPHRTGSGKCNCLKPVSETKQEKGANHLTRKH